MQINCTKKLLDELDFPIEEADEENDFFSWSANLIMINRRRTVVLINDNNQFGLILHDLKQRDFKKLDQLILTALRAYLKEEKIIKDIVDRYISAAGNIRFAKSRNRSYIARLNFACERASLQDEFYFSDETIQHYPTMKINSDLIKYKDGYYCPYEMLHKDLIEFAGEDIVLCEAVDLVVKLDLGEHSAWRKIITPSNITFKQLHQILQVAFQWNDYHLYDFNIMDTRGNIIMNIVSEYEEIYDAADSSVKFDGEVMLSDFMSKGTKILYCYDYGDNWEHLITIQGSRQDYNKNYPVCLLGAGDTPPEDVGGIWGYQEFLTVMSDPNHEDYKALKEWSRMQRHIDFNIDYTNLKLKNVLRK